VKGKIQAKLEENDSPFPFVEKYLFEMSSKNFIYYKVTNELFFFFATGV
jgi:hypothetical protein